VVAAALAPADAQGASLQAWPAFVLVAALLIIGALAAEDGLFAAAGARVARLPGSGLRLLTALLLFEACVTAVLNLDTAVVFLTPVLLHAARRRGLAEEPFLYGAVFMANSASLLLPGSNLTNLIVLTHEHVPGHLFAARMFPAWIAAITATIAVVTFLFRRPLAAEGAPSMEHVPLRLGFGAVGIVASIVLVLVLQRPAIPLLATALALAFMARLQLRTLFTAANPVLLLGVFATAVALGTLARGVETLADFGESLGRWPTALVGAGGSLLVNNLPAAVVLSAHAPTHARALLIGLDLGPNLAVTGSLSAVLWLQVARREGARPSALRYTVLGLAVVPITFVLAMFALTLFAPRSF
jgi:arsenical pump membrane protein